MTIRLSLLLSSLLLIVNAHAGIYKTVDQYGNVVYSDTPSDSGEEVQLKEPTEVPSLAPSSGVTRSISLPEETEIVYDRFEIVAPKNNETIRNSGNFQIRVALHPNLARKHRVRFVIDGQSVSKPQRSLQHAVSNMDRGSHQLKVELLDQKNKVLKSTSSTVHVRRTIFRPPSSN